MSETRLLDPSLPGSDVETSFEVPAVLCQGLGHRFGEHVALDGIDLVVRPAEVFGLLGPNGAGVALMHLGTIRDEGSPDELKHALGPGATLEDVFRHSTGDTLDGSELGKGGLREIRRTRRTARRLG